MATYTDTQLKKLFQSSFNPDEWQNLLQNFFGATELRRTPEELDMPDIGRGYYLGCIDTSDSFRIGLFRYDIAKGSVTNKRVGLRNLVRTYINQRYGSFDAALAVFDSGDHWRLSFICDIKDEATSPKRFTYVFGDNYNLYKTPVERFVKLKSNGITFANIKDAFSVEALSKDFYNKLYLWYQWALSPEIGVTFPNNPETEKDDRENLHVKLIRLITRMLFVWFIKQKHLVPDNIFDVSALKDILVNFDEKSYESGNYYNAILQNLFFATLNCAVIDEDGNPRHFANASARDTRNLYRYAEMFNMSEHEVINLFSYIPFLNGGLFECLDKPKGLYIDLEHDILYDGFSRNATRSSNGNYKYRAFIPNILFFNDDEQQPGLITLFSQYNFTIEENSPTDAEISLDPELLGRVFENLLAAYNPETQESARKSTGSFYTPREIVDYMVDESLKTYLLGAGINGLNANMLDALFNNHVITSEWTNEIVDGVTAALKRVKILDPACGSGAFPMGCMLRIVEIVELLHNDEIDRYQLKLDIIENCVFGVDIQPIAMLICKLRFFISLVCEQKDIDFNDPTHNYGINTLPNLETKFVAANTLLSAEIRKFDKDWTADDQLRSLQEQLLTIRNHHLLAKGRKAKRQCQREDKAKRTEILQYIVDHAQKMDERRIAEWEEQIKSLKTQFEQYKENVWVDELRPVENTLFGPVQTPQALFRKDLNEPKRNELLKSIHNIEDNIKKEKRKAEINGFEAAVKQITEWDPYDQNSVSPFFDPEWMFCLKEKFDIVIGNPPYIQLQNNGGELAKLYEPCGYKTFAKTGDIYCLFYERGYQLLKPNGLLCYITSNKWMRAGYGEKTRKFFAKNTDPQLLIDFAGVKIFESATVDTNILLFVKAVNEHKTLCVVTNKQNKDSVKNLSIFVQQQGVECDFTESDSWVILSPIEQSIKRKIEAVGVPLKDWDIQINYGIKTGFNDAFIISTEKRNEILSNCMTEEEYTRTVELIRPILRGRDIKRYGYDWANLYLIATFPACHYDIENYPAIKKYLLSFAEDDLRKAGYNWVADSYLAEFCKQKLDQTGKFVEIKGERIVIGKTPEKARKKTSNMWFETQDSISYWEDFFKPKIIYPNMTKYMPFVYDNEEYITNQKCFIITGYNVAYLTAFFNSSLFKYCFRDSFPELQGGTREMSKIFFDKIPVLKVTGEVNEEFMKLIDDIQKEFTIEKAIHIDERLFDLYNLSPEERKVIGFIEIN